MCLDTAGHSVSGISRGFVFGTLRSATPFCRRTLTSSSFPLAENGREGSGRAAETFRSADAATFALRHCRVPFSLRKTLLQLFFRAARRTASPLIPPARLKCGAWALLVAWGEHKALLEVSSCAPWGRCLHPRLLFFGPKSAFFRSGASKSDPSTCASCRSGCCGWER